MNTFKHIFTVALKASLLSKLLIFLTIFQPWASSSDIPATKRGLFTKYMIDHVNILNLLEQCDRRLFL